jgi:hypothetical protein
MTGMDLHRVKGAMLPTRVAPQELRYQVHQVTQEEVLLMATWTIVLD